MRTTTLGRGGPVVSRVGLGLMGMSFAYGPADETESIATIRAAAAHAAAALQAALTARRPSPARLAGRGAADHFSGAA